jgi:hypothetical protein
VRPIPETVDLRWIARHLVAARDELRLDIRALREDETTLREDMGIMSVIVRRIDRQVSALRDDVRTLYEQHRDLRERVETPLLVGVNVHADHPPPGNLKRHLIRYDDIKWEIALDCVSSGSYFVKVWLDAAKR